MRRSLPRRENVRRGARWSWAAAAVAVCVLVCTAGEPAAREGFPRLANIYFGSLVGVDLELAARWDVLALMNRADEVYQDEIATIRELNPDIVLLVGIPVGYHGDWTGDGLNGELTAKINECDWYMRDTTGEVVILPGAGGINGEGNRLLNVTLECPVDSDGKRLCEWLPAFFAERLLPGGRWDGAWLDSCMNRISWLNQYLDAEIDIDQDGVAEGGAELDAAWRAGMEVLVSGLREEFGEDFILNTNGSNTFYEDCDGATREDFPAMGGGWYENITNPEHGYLAIEALYRQPAYNIVNVVWGGPVDENGPLRTWDFRRRFGEGLASTLVFGNGYFSMDGGSGLNPHSQMWWHEYYDVDLGLPLGGAEPVASSPGDPYGMYHGDMISRRRFDNGIAIVNPTCWIQRVDLEGWYRPIDSWNGQFYPSNRGTRCAQVLPQSGEVLAGNGRMLGPPAIEYAEYVDGAIELGWGEATRAGAYSVYRCEPYADDSKTTPALLAVVQGTSYRDEDVETGWTYEYRVAAIDSSNCEGQLSCPTDILTAQGSDLSIALIALDEPDGALALAWDPIDAEPGLSFDLFRTEQRCGRVMVSDEPIPAGVAGRIVDNGVVGGRTYLYEAVLHIDGEERVAGSVRVTAPLRCDARVVLHGCRPHPVTNSATISFSLSNDKAWAGGVPVSLVVYDVAGRVVRRLVDGTLSPGSHSAEWDARSDGGERVASGCYFYVLTVEDETLAGKMLVLR